MVIKDFVDNEQALFKKRVWNISKTAQGTIIKVDMEDRYPSVVIAWDHKLNNSCFFIGNLENELVEDE